MRYTGFIIAIFSLLSAVGISAADDTDYYVESWFYNAKVHTDNTWNVRETVTVNFVKPHHGIFIYRPQLFADIHKSYGKDAVYTYRLSVNNINVSGHEFMTEENDDSQDNLIIRIGSADEMLSGIVIYDISYILCYPDDRVEDNDFICHSVLGDGWNSNIRNFSFNISFDEPLPKSAFSSARVYSGEWGSKDDALHVSDSLHVSELSIYANLSDIPARNAISLHMTLPQGYFSGNTGRDSTAFCLFLIVSLLLGVYILVKLLLSHPKRPVVTVEFYPPENITSAEVGTIIDSDADVSDLVSLIPYFAKMGFLRISEKESGKGIFGKKSKLWLEKIKDMDSSYPKYQRLFFDALFTNAENGRVEVSDLGDCHKKIEKAQQSLSSIFKGKKSLSYYKNSVWALIALIITSSLAFMISSTVEDFGDTSVSGFILLVSGLLNMGVMILVARSRAYNSSLLIARTFCLAVSAGSIFVYHLLYNSADCFFPPYLGEILLAVVYVSTVLADRYYVDTDYRISMIGKLLGLKEFIRTAKLDQLKSLVDETPEYFYDILPYAMVFGLTDKWAEHFKNIEILKPDWYMTDNFFYASQISSISGVSHICDSIQKTISECVLESSHDISDTSVSSSGGFSGCGGGGGGGGAW